MLGIAPTPLFSLHTMVNNVFINNEQPAGDSYDLNSSSRNSTSMMKSAAHQFGHKSNGGPRVNDEDASSRSFGLSKSVNGARATNGTGGHFESSFFSLPTPLSLNDKYQLASCGNGLRSWAPETFTFLEPLEPYHLSGGKASRNGGGKLPSVSTQSSSVRRAATQPYTLGRPSVSAVANRLLPKENIYLSSTR